MDDKEITNGKISFEELLIKVNKELSNHEKFKNKSLINYSVLDCDNYTELFGKLISLNCNPCQIIIESLVN